MSQKREVIPTPRVKLSEASGNNPDCRHQIAHFRESGYGYNIVLSETEVTFSVVKIAYNPETHKLTLEDLHDTKCPVKTFDDWSPFEVRMIGIATVQLLEYKLVHSEWRQFLELLNERTVEYMRLYKDPKVFEAHRNSHDK